MRTLTTISAAALLAVGLSAQTTVNTIPTGFGTTKGSSGLHWVMRYGSGHGICKYGKAATGMTKPTVINQLAMRNDESWYSTTALKVAFTVTLSTNKVPVDNITDTAWAKHHGTTKTVWITKVAYNRAAFVRKTTGTNPFDLVFKGARPFVVLDGTLAVELQAYCGTAHYNPYHYLDAQYTGKSSGTRGTYRTFGRPCNPTSFYNYSTGYNEGDTFRTYCYTRNSGDIVLAWLGAKGIALSIGNGCSLYTVPIIMHPVPVKTTSSTGYANFVWGKVPTGMKGKMLYSQHAAVTAKLAMRFSRRNDITFGNYMTTYLGRSLYTYNSSRTASIDPDKDPAKYWSGTVGVFERK